MMEKTHTENTAHPVCMYKTEVVSMGGYDNLFVGEVFGTCLRFVAKSHLKFGREKIRKRKNSEEKKIGRE